jgi:hypothetical protein
MGIWMTIRRLAGLPNHPPHLGEDELGLTEDGNLYWDRPDSGVDSDPEALYYPRPHDDADERGEGAVDLQQVRTGASDSSVASGEGSFVAGGTDNEASGSYSHAEGSGSHAEGASSHAEGSGSHAEGASSHAEGDGSHAEGNRSHAEGVSSHAQGHYSHAEGSGSHAEGAGSHAEGVGSHAQGHYSHAEGSGSHAQGHYSHAEGSGSHARGRFSHAEGSGSYAQGYYSHAEGSGSHAEGAGSHAEGSGSYAQGYYSHAEGRDSHALRESQHALASGVFGENGDAQQSQIVARRKTTDGTASVVMDQGTAFTLEVGRCYKARIDVVARNTGADEQAAYTLELLCVRPGGVGTTKILGSVDKSVLHEDVSAWDVGASADTSGGKIDIEVTGESGKTIRWVAFIEWVEVGF